MRRLLRLLGIPRTWRIPTPARVMIFGRTGSEVLQNYIAESVHQYEHPDDILNVRVLFRALLTGKLSSEGYLLSYLTFVKPDVVVTMEDNNPLFYRISAARPSVRTIAVQNGRRDNFASSPEGGFFEELTRLRHNSGVYVDTLCIFGSAILPLYSAALGSSGYRKACITGSLRNNAVAPTLSNGKPRVLYISSMPNFELGSDPESEQTLAYYHGSPITFNDNWSWEAAVVREAAGFARVNGMEFVVVGKRSSRHGGERMHFEVLLKNQNFTFCPAENQTSSYREVQPSDAVIAVDGTLAYEMLGRGIRVGFASARLTAAGLGHFKDCNFGFPMKLEDRGPFWTNQADPGEVHRILDFLTSSTDQEWSSISTELRRQLMAYDQMNHTFCELLRELGIQSTGARFWDDDLIPEN